MAQLILNHSSEFHRMMRAETAFPLSMRIGKFFLLFSMMFMIGLISFFYLLKFTEITTKGYQLQKLEREHSILVNAQEIKNTDIARIRSLQSIRDNSVASGMVPSHSPLYIRRDASIAELPNRIGRP